MAVISETVRQLPMSNTNNCVYVCVSLQALVFARNMPTHLPSMQMQHAA